MKNLVFLFLMALLVSCSGTEDANPVQQDPTLEQILSTNPASGTTPSSPGTSTNPSAGEAWRIHLFVEDGYDITKNFVDIRLLFDESGAIQAKLGNETISGRWRIKRDSPRDELYLDFPDGSLLDELDDDWYIRSRSETEIILDYDDDEYESEMVWIRENAASSIRSPFSNQKDPALGLFNEVSQSQFEINAFWDDDRNRTLLFEGGILNFGDWGKVTLERAGQNPIEGIWLVGFNDRNVLLDLDFPSTGLGDYLDEEWLLQDKSGNLIRLIEKDDEYDDRDRMELKKK